MTHRGGTSALSKSALDLFLLLLLVMVSQDSVRQAMYELTAPALAVTSAEGVALSSEPCVIRILPTGDYRIGEIVVRRGELSVKLKQLREQGTIGRVVIEGTTEAYVELLAEVHALGLRGRHAVTVRQGKRTGPRAR